MNEYGWTLHRTAPALAFDSGNRKAPKPAAARVAGNTAPATRRGFWEKNCAVWRQKWILNRPVTAHRNITSSVQRRCTPTLWRCGDLAGPKYWGRRKLSEKYVLCGSHWVPTRDQPRSFIEGASYWRCKLTLSIGGASSKNIYIYIYIFISFKMINIIRHKSKWFTFTTHNSKWSTYLPTINQHDYITLTFTTHNSDSKWWKNHLPNTYLSIPVLLPPGSSCAALRCVPAADCSTERTLPLPRPSQRRCSAGWWPPACRRHPPAEHVGLSQVERLNLVIASIPLKNYTTYH